MRSPTFGDFLRLQERMGWMNHHLAGSRHGLEAGFYRFSYRDPCHRRKLKREGLRSAALKGKGLPHAVKMFIFWPVCLCLKKIHEILRLCSIWQPACRLLRRDGYHRPIGSGFCGEMASHSKLSWILFTFWQYVLPKCFLFSGSEVS